MARNNTEYTQTAIMRSDGVPLPPSVFRATGFALDHAVTFESTEPGLVIVSGQDRRPDLGKPGMSSRGVLSITKKDLARVGLRTGDIVEFRLRDPMSIEISSINWRDHPSFVSPQLDDDGRPLPPSWLVQAFTGQPDIESFTASGKAAVRALTEYVRRTGGDIAGLGRIVDFGCGCGRVLRHLPDVTKAEVLGFDLHADAIEWCSRHLPFAQFFNGTEYPPMSLADASVDLLYAISVLTHLDESHQDRWLAEWQRVLRPGGIIIATYRDEDYLRAYPHLVPIDALLPHIDGKNALVFQDHTYWQGIFPSYYAGTYHGKAYVKDHWGAYFDILFTTLPGEFPNLQNAAVMRKR